MISSFDGRFWGPEKEVVVGDLGAPKAVMNDMTMQGISMNRIARLGLSHLLNDPCWRNCMILEI